jgi:chromosome segregation ATPase
MEALQQANSALNQANDAHKGHIESMKAAETDLRAKMSLQTEKVRNMGKFLKGIGTDCDGFKANMKLQQEKCSSDLKKAIAEVQKDKVALEQDFLATVKTLEKSQRTMKQTLDECFVRLQISEARKKDLEDALKAKSLVCKEESDKRVRLEQQIMGSIQSLQSQVEEGQGSLVEKLGAVQASLDMMAPDESRDTLIQEYMTALKDFRETPLLTIKDVQKAEGMLQFLRTRFVVLLLPRLCTDWLQPGVQIG